MKYLILLASLCGLSLGYTRIDPLVSTKGGLIRGLRDENGYVKFLGVPYGSIDENNVFGAAVPHPGFDEGFEAYDDSKICVQVDFSGSAVGTTDCLNLNLYVPDAASSNNRFPVMVWIHGGGFIRGSAIEHSADPHSLVRHDVIVVTINYRLGVFGFMCLDIPEVPGNTGLKDQALALKWVKENIAAFGGDANQITVFGESAGGMSTNLHLFSSNEKLFDRVVIQSGPGNSPWTIVESDDTIPIRLAKELDFNTTDIKEALSFISELDPLIVTKTAHDLLISNANGTNQPLTKPCIEQKFDGVENFLTEYPINVTSNKINNMPVIIGHNSLEIAFQYANIDGAFFDSYDFGKQIARAFDIDNNVDEVLDIVRHFYIGDEIINESVKWELTNYDSDFVFNHPTQRMARKLMDSGANVYSYVFSYSGSSDKSWSGAAHGEELSYLFDLNGEKSSQDQLLVDGMTKLWTNFAKFGDPNPTTSELLPMKWTPITATTYPYLDIDTELTLKSRPFHDRMAFWDLFYKQYGKY